MKKLIAETEICKTCGCEISGEVCVNCYTKYDQSMDSYTSGENVFLYFFLSIGLILFSIAIYAFDEANPEVQNNFINSTKIIVITGQMVFTFLVCLLVFFKRINLKTAKSMITIGAIVVISVVLKG